MPGVATTKGEWAPREEDFLRRSWGQRPTSEIAIVLNRPPGAIGKKALRLGLTTPRTRREDYELVLRDLHAEGLSDSEIARRVGRTQSKVSVWLRALNLAPHFQARAFTPATQAKIQQGNRTRARLMGYASWSDYMVSRRRMKQQWEYPGCITPGEVVVARLLRDAGDKGLTAREALPLTAWKNHRTPLYLLRRLHGAGMARRVLEQGQKTGRYRYFLVVRCTQAR